MQLSDYVIDVVAQEGVKIVFMVSGGGGMYLIEALGNRKDIQFVCNHHEQASTIAAEGYQRITENLGVALVTTGPAATNTITGICCAWCDSIPLLVISGQANSKFLVGNTGLRQRAVHEIYITRIVESITKYAVTITDASTIRYHLEKAIYLARHGRPGPVLLDIPLDIQPKEIDPAKLEGFEWKKEFPQDEPKPIPEISQVKTLLAKATRPIILLGNGVRLGKGQKEFFNLVDRFQIPFVTTKNAFDIVEDSHPLLAGRVGNYGQRAANFAVQNSDLVIVLGSRLPFPTVGYSSQWFAREAKHVVVDIDSNQLKCSHIRIDLPILANVKDFLTQLYQAMSQDFRGDYGSWIKRCIIWRQKYPTVLPEWRADGPYINPYYFFEVLSDEMDNTDILVCDQGATFYCFTTSFKVKKGQHAYTNGGFSALGYGLPSAIGACFAHKKQRVILANGDGGLQFNIQELQTIAQHQLPIKIFYFNNDGYVSIKHTQMAYFNSHFVGSNPESGLTMPDIAKIAHAYGMKYMRCNTHSKMQSVMRDAINADGPVIVDLIMDPFGSIEPRVSTAKRPDGSLVSKPIEDMYPFLDREEFKKEMIVKPVD